ncbi:hypothetical protein [Nevskia ramosa]|uniref:hypothetical protein n=1 Tax=Nevskia ramosa TaxID=64002 RepID=UPI003D134268
MNRLLVWLFGLQSESHETQVQLLAERMARSQRPPMKVTRPTAPLLNRPLPLKRDETRAIV